MAVKTFTSERLTSSDVNTYLTNSGLVWLREVTPNAASTVEVTSIFNASYENYRIIYRFYGSANTYSFFQFLTGTNTPVTTNYWRRGYTAAGTLVLTTASATNDWFSGDVYTTADIPNYGIMDIFGANKATRPSGFCMHYNHAGPVAMSWQGGNEITTPTTGFRFGTAPGNTLTGKIWIYGYRQA